MAKQIFNSFKELQGLLPENKVVQEKQRKSNPKIKADKPAVSSEKFNPPKFNSKKFKRENNKFSTKPAVPIDPKLQAIFDALTWLKTTFPQAFISPPAKILPLKIGIGQDIAEYIKTKEAKEFSLTLVRKALSMYTNNFRYLVASSVLGASRVDLQGNNAGDITAEQVEYAQTKLAALKERRKNKERLLETTTESSPAKELNVENNQQP